jgi:hypothetical protein
MAKVKTGFFCQNCGYESAKWVGRCPSCNEWNTFAEELITKEKNNPAAQNWKEQDTRNVKTIALLEDLPYTLFVVKEEYDKYDYPNNLRQPLKYCSNTNVDPEDYLFVSLNGELENATLFGQAKNYEYQKSGPDYEVIVWKKAEDGTDNITNVPITQVNENYSHLPTFEDVGYPSDPLKFFVERPKDETPPTCFKRFMNSLNGSGTKRRRKNKRNSSNKKRKQRKSSNKRRRH